MYKSIAVTALVGIMTIAGIAEAGAYSRSGSGTTAQGRTFGSTGTRQCTGGACSQSQTVTGPRGNTAVRTGSGSCAGGSCTTSRSVTGPAGRGFSRSATFRR